MRFYKVAIGARFTLRGLQYQKTALGFAVGIGESPEGHRDGSSFMGETEVVADGPFLAAYQQAILTNDCVPVRALGSVVIDSAQPGPVHVKVWNGRPDYFNAFMAALSLWRSGEHYDPRAMLQVG